VYILPNVNPYLLPDLSESDSLCSFKPEKVLSNRKRKKKKWLVPNLGPHAVSSNEMVRSDVLWRLDLRKASCGVDIDLGVCSCGIGKKWIGGFEKHYGIELTELGYWY
jgi:hypothetical protein